MQRAWQGRVNATRPCPTYTITSLGLLVIEILTADANLISDATSQEKLQCHLETGFDADVWTDRIIVDTTPSERGQKRNQYNKRAIAGLLLADIP